MSEGYEVDPVTGPALEAGAKSQSWAEEMEYISAISNEQLRNISLENGYTNIQCNLMTDLMANGKTENDILLKYPGLFLNGGKQNFVDFPPLNPNSKSVKRALNINENMNETPTKKNNSNEFQPISKRLTAKKNYIFNKPESNATTSNKFEALKELTEESVNEVADNPPPPSAPKPTPITVLPKGEYHVRTWLMNLAEVTKRKFNGRPIGNEIKIYPETDEDHRALTKYLKDNKIDYYVVEEMLDYPLKAVIRNLENDEDLDLLKRLIEEKNFIVKKISQFTNYRSPDKEKLPLYQIHLPNIEESKKIFEVKDLALARVKIEPYINPKQVMQCHNCQHFHHSSRTCNVAPRCVRCPENHQSENCPLGTARIKNPVCCNCLGPHAASYRGCPKYPKPRKNLPASKVREGKSYAQMLGTTNTSSEKVQNQKNLTIGGKLNQEGIAKGVDTLKGLASLIEAARRISECLGGHSPDTLAKLMNETADKMTEASYIGDKVYLLINGLQGLSCKQA